jgi:DNA-3-methyladenine glycosylase II
MSFPNIGRERTFRLGANHISRVDPKLRQLVKKHGPIEFTTGDDPFESLVEAIISQQLNGRAARMIFGKLKALLHTDIIDAPSLHKVSASRLRKVGVSPQKIRYLRDLSSRVVRGKLNLENLKNMPDDEVIQILDEVKGIGPWTAHMFLLFTLGRPDVLPVDDLGIQTSIRKVYSLRQLPDGKRIQKIAKNWHPYCSVASLYLWHSKDT